MAVVTMLGKLLLLHQNPNIDSTAALNTTGDKLNKLLPLHQKRARVVTLATRCVVFIVPPFPVAAAALVEVALEETEV